MNPHDFEGTWLVRPQPEPIGETAGHVVAIDLYPTGSQVIAEISCDDHGSSFMAEYDSQSHTLIGADFTISHSQRVIECKPRVGAEARGEDSRIGPGSWTAEDNGSEDGRKS